MRYSAVAPKYDSEFNLNQNINETSFSGDFETDASASVHAASKGSKENLLGQYFREVASLPVLRPDQEFELAKKIEDAETRLWVHILSFVKLIEPILSHAEANFKKDSLELANLMDAARAFISNPNKTNRHQLKLLRSISARTLIHLDVERIFLKKTVKEIKKLARYKKTSFFDKSLRFNRKAPTFVFYMKNLQKLEHLVEKARNDFVHANLRLVVTIARRFNFGSIPFQDLIQEGNIGLLKAVSRYDYRRGYRFSTYASWWIRHAITRAIADKGRLVRVPVHMLSTYQKVSRKSRELSVRLGREPTNEEIEASTAVSLEKIEDIQDHLPNQALSLDTKISDTDDRNFVEMLHDFGTPETPEKIGEQEVFQQTLLTLGELKPMEADILRKRFGMHDGTEHTLSEIGRTYGLSRERIRQIQEIAIAKIRRSLKRKNAL